jgi:hypothetical protein
MFNNKVRKTKARVIYMDYPAWELLEKWAKEETEKAGKAYGMGRIAQNLIYKADKNRKEVS